MKNVETNLKTFGGKIYDLCYYLLDEYDSKEEVFEFVCKNFDGEDGTGEFKIQEFFTDDEIHKLKYILGPIINGYIEYTAKQCDFGIIEWKSFYSHLWEKYILNFTESKELAFAFYYTIIDGRIPYRYLGTPSGIDDDKFKEILESNIEIVKDIERIKKADFSKRTEDSSLLLNCLNKVNDYETKVVMLAVALAIFNDQKILSNSALNMIINQVKSKIDE